MVLLSYTFVILDLCFYMIDFMFNLIVIFKYVSEAANYFYLLVLLKTYFA